MEFITEIMSILWHFVEKNRKCAINITTIENNLIVNILIGRKRKTFSNKDGKLLLKEIQQFAI